MRLIDADALPVVAECCMDEAGYLAKFNVVCEEDIKKAPTIEAEPVKHGRWLQPKSGECFCSECKTNGSPHWKRCPVCEAKMATE